MNTYSIQINHTILHSVQNAPLFMIDSIGVFLCLQQLLLLYRLNKHWHQQLSSVATSAWNALTLELKYSPQAPLVLWNLIVFKPIFKHIRRLKFDLSDASIAEWLLQYTAQLQHLHSVSLTLPNTLHITRGSILESTLNHCFAQMHNLTHFSIKGLTGIEIATLVLQLPRLLHFQIHCSIIGSQCLQWLPDLRANACNWKTLSITGDFIPDSLNETLAACVDLLELKLQYILLPIFRLLGVRPPGGRLRPRFQKVEPQITEINCVDATISIIGQRIGLRRLELVDLQTSSEFTLRSLFTFPLSQSLQSLILHLKTTRSLTDVPADIVFLHLQRLHIQFDEQHTFAEIVRLFPSIQELAMVYTPSQMLFSSADLFLLKN